jgi:dihydroorotate dehydrogenase electron transfer subunit
MSTDLVPIQSDARILANHRYRPWLYRLTIAAPSIALVIRPGQFLMIRPSWGNDPLLGRPLAVYDVVRDDQGIPQAVEVIYQIFGRGTRRLSQMTAGEEVRVWGPLGHPFAENPGADRIWFVAGGIGYTPFLALWKWWTGAAPFGGISIAAHQPPEIEMIYGARTSEMMPPLDEFGDAGLTVRLCTEDGSVGMQGRVTDLMTGRWNDSDPESRPRLVVACGPEPMLAAVAQWCSERKVACQVSLENQMACGFGACFSCVAPIRQSDGTTDLKRVCIEGPIFEACSVDWGTHAK